VFFCYFQLWPLFPSDQLVRCSVESNIDATHIGALKTMFSVWSCEVAIRRMIGEDIDWLLWSLLDDYHLKLKVGCRIDVKAKLFRRQNAKDISHCLNSIFCRFQLCFLLLSCWLQTRMDGYVNYGEEFAGMSRRQVRRCHRLHILATSSQKRQILMLQRLGSHSLKEISTFISDTFAERYYVLIFDITWMMYTSLNDTSLFGLFIYERHFCCLDMSEEKSVQLTMYCSNILFGLIVTYGEKLYRCDYCLLMLVDYFSTVS